MRIETRIILIIVDLNFVLNEYFSYCWMLVGCMIYDFDCCFPSLGSTLISRNNKLAYLIEPIKCIYLDTNWKLDSCPNFALDDNAIRKNGCCMFFIGLS